MNRFLAAIVLAWPACWLSGCTGGRTVFAYAPSTGGDATHGKALITDYDCGSCHTIPGVSNADGMVAPPLVLFGRRTYIAGEVPNTPDNLVKWLRDPKSVEPGTAMPQLGLTEAQARDIAAYLYTLRSKSWSGGGE